MKKFTLVLSLLTALIAYNGHFARADGVDPDADFDRLDGTGASGKRVDVIEWEGNLEVHVYPHGSLKGLGLKLDRRNKDKPVMVIAYRFTNNPKDVLIRRAILGIDIQDGFKAFKDPTESDFDKIIISNNGLSGQVTAFRLDPTPTQLYPDGHPALASGPAGPPGGYNPSSASARGPASQGAAAQGQDQAPSVDSDSGSIQPFFMKRR
jgi:hypothetical protein